MLRIYQSPAGYTFQYEEGEQPDDYILVDPPKAKKTANKSKAPRNKSAKKEQ